MKPETHGAPADSLDAIAPIVHELTAKSAAIAIATMDPHAREDLIAYVNDFSEARKTGDAEDQQYILEAIEELFRRPVASAITSAPTLDDVEAELLASPAGREARQRVDAEIAGFLSRYHTLKAAAGLATQAEVAQRAGLSPTTVQAVESGKVWPQTRTVQKLARAFGVEVNRLLTG